MKYILWRASLAFIAGRMTVTQMSGLRPENRSLCLLLATRLMGSEQEQHHSFSL